MSIAVFQANGHYRQNLLFVNTPLQKNFKTSHLGHTPSLKDAEKEAQLLLFLAFGECALRVNAQITSVVPINFITHVN